MQGAVVQYTTFTLVERFFTILTSQKTSWNYRWYIQIAFWTPIVNRTLKIVHAPTVRPKSLRQAWPNPVNAPMFLDMQQLVYFDLPPAVWTTVPHRDIKGTRAIFQVPLLTRQNLPRMPTNHIRVLPVHAQPARKFARVTGRGNWFLGELIFTTVESDF